MQEITIEEADFANVKDREESSLLLDEYSLDSMSSSLVEMAFPVSIIESSSSSRSRSA